MAILRKKGPKGGTESGVKFICDICSVDVTSTVRIRCAQEVCIDYDLCVTCFSQAKHSKEHDPRTHQFHVIEQHSVPIFTEDWGADEELLLLEGAEIYGLGSWADIADHIGGYRTKEEVRDHYINTYIWSPNFPLPELFDPKVTGGLERISRDEFLARKKQRIETRKEEVKAEALAPAKAGPKSSVPSCHEVAGYMPARLDFETEYANDAEEAVQNMQFDPGDGIINSETGEVDPETELKLTVMDIYNNKLTQRVERKRVIFEHNLLECKRIMAEDRLRIKEERDLLNKAKPFIKVMNHADHKAFTDGLIEELNLRSAIASLQEWRRMGVTSLTGGAKYEADKAHRLHNQKLQNMGQFDRMAGINKPKSAPPEHKSAAALAYLSPTLDAKPPKRPRSPEPLGMKNGTKVTNGHSTPPLTNGLTNGVLPVRTKFAMPLIPNINPLELNDENSADLQLLSEEERELCRTIRCKPRPYIMMKEAIVRAAVAAGGAGIKKKTVKDICKIDANKSDRILAFFVHQGWVKEAK